MSNMDELKQIIEAQRAVIRRDRRDLKWTLGALILVVIAVVALLAVS